MEFRTAQQPGDIEIVLKLHRDGYRGFDWRFEAHNLDQFLAHVQATMAEVDLQDRQRNQLLFAEANGQTFGCAGLLTKGTKGQLRWVVLLPGSRGRGLGKQMVQQAITFARDLDLDEVFLETTDGLDASMSLYESMGFVTASDSTEQLWFGEGHLITMTMPLV